MAGYLVLLSSLSQYSIHNRRLICNLSSSCWPVQFTVDSIYHCPNQTYNWISMEQTQPKDLHSHPINESQRLSLSVGDQFTFNTYMGGVGGWGAVCGLDYSGCGIMRCVIIVINCDPQTSSCGDCVKSSPFSRSLGLNKTILVMMGCCVSFSSQTAEWFFRTGDLWELQRQNKSILSFGSFDCSDTKRGI